MNEIPIPDDERRYIVQMAITIWIADDNKSMNDALSQAVQMDKLVRERIKVLEI